MLIGVEIVHMSTFKVGTVEKNSSSSIGFLAGMDDDFFRLLCISACFTQVN